MREDGCLSRLLLAGEHHHPPAIENCGSVQEQPMVVSSGRNDKLAHDTEGPAQQGRWTDRTDLDPTRADHVRRREERVLDDQLLTAFVAGKTDDLTVECKAGNHAAVIETVAVSEREVGSTDGYVSDDFAPVIQGKPWLQHLPQPAR